MGEVQRVVCDRMSEVMALQGSHSVIVINEFHSGRTEPHIVEFIGEFNFLPVNWVSMKRIRKIAGNWSRDVSNGGRVCVFRTFHNTSPNLI